MEANLIEFFLPYCVFLGDVADDTYGKTGIGLAQWRPEGCIGQVRLPGCGANAGVPDLTIEQSVAAGARTLVVGSAAVGGGVPEHWIATLCAAAAQEVGHRCRLAHPVGDPAGIGGSGENKGQPSH